MRPDLLSSGGSTLRQISCAFQHRVWKLHPGGGSTGLGTSPASLILPTPRGTLRRRPERARRQQRPRVTDGAASRTHRHRDLDDLAEYITATRSRCAHDRESWAMKT